MQEYLKKEICITYTHPFGEFIQSLMNCIFGFSCVFYRLDEDRELLH